jgi:hypothetical protein
MGEDAESEMGWLGLKTMKRRVGRIIRRLYRRDLNG